MNHHPPCDYGRASRWTSVVLLVASSLQWGLWPGSAETLKEPDRAADRLSPAAFADPPMQTRSGCFWAWLNGSITTEQITRDLEAMRQGGMRGGEIWDVAAHADPDRRVPAGPAFQRAFLDQLAKGYRYKEIADNLGIGMDGVRSYIRRIYEKLHVHSRTEAVVKYLAH
jgi:hypothetical protein